MIERHYKTRELADLLSLNPETIRRAVEDGDMRAVRVDGELIYLDSDVQAWLDRRRSPVYAERIGSVYFIQAGSDGPIKIGFAKNPEARLRDLQPGNHRTLFLRATRPGTGADERHHHERFASARLIGEWFAPVPALLSYIKEIA